MVVPLFSLPNYPLPILSPADDAGISTGGSNTTLFDRSKYWAPGIWQGALLIVSVDDQIFTTIINTNSEQILSFPAFPSGTKISQNNYQIKRLPPSLVRPGISLTGTQTLVLGAFLALDIINPASSLVPFQRFAVPPGGVNTVANPVTMTNPAMALIPNAYIGFRIYNVTDMSRGTIIANTAITVTVAGLTGGIANTWGVGDAYLFAGVITDITDMLPYLPIPAGYTGSVIEIFDSFNQPAQILFNIDNLIFFLTGTIPTGGGTNDTSQISSVSNTAIYDPTASFAHAIIVDIITRGAGYMSGSAQITGIREQLIVIP